jgi:integral membrane sensor domain MASE1
MIERLLPSLSPGSRLLLLNVALGLAYHLTARLGVALAIGPLDITAIWPPAGIALAGLMLWGLRVLPGLALASLLSHHLGFFSAQAGSGWEAWFGAVARRAGAGAPDGALRCHSGGLLLHWRHGRPCHADCA